MKITKEQQEIIDQFEGHWGMDFMYKDTIHDHKSFYEAFYLNQKWMTDHTTVSEGFITEYANKYIDEIA